MKETVNMFETDNQKNESEKMTKSNEPATSPVFTWSTKKILFIFLGIVVAGGIAAAIAVPLTRKKKEEKLYEINDYGQISPNDQNYIYIPVFGTNDLHGFFFPRIVKINSELSYKNSSVYYYSKYLEIIRKEFGEKRVLWLDGGDYHTGGAELVTSKEMIVTDFMNVEKITAATIGNHEYDLDYDKFVEIIKASNFPYISSNNIGTSSTDFKVIEAGNGVTNGHKKYIIKEIELSNGDKIKIGILGVGAKMDKEGKNAINGKGWNDFEFKDYAVSIKETVDEMKREHEDLNSIIASIHEGMCCGKDKILNLYTKNMTRECEGNLLGILNQLDNGFIDLVISGDKSELVHDWVNGIPVISGLDGGQFSNIAYLPFKKNNGKYELVKDELKIEGPLPNCEKIFKNTKICDGVTTEEEYNRDGPLINFNYHGIKMEQPPTLNGIIEKYYPDYKDFNEIEICNLYGLQESIYGKEPTGDGYVPNLVSDIIKQKTESDVVILNVGALRASWDMGGLTKAEVYSMFPFEDYFCIVEITGEELKRILQIVQPISERYYGTSGLLQIIEKKPDGKKTVVEVKLFKDGKEEDIDDDHTYRMGTIDYIALKYGDEFDAVKKAGIEFKNTKCQNESKDLNWNLRIIEALQEMKSIDISKYKDKDHPRLKEIEVN